MELEAFAFLSAKVSLHIQKGTLKHEEDHSTQDPVGQIDLGSQSSLWSYL